MDGELKQNLTAGSTWVRVLYMVLFGVAFYVAEFVLIVVVVVQLVAKLIGGKTLAQLDRFGAQLAAYFREVSAFLTYASERRPFPLAPWPDAEPESGPVSTTVPTE
jgi:hypothetical protein